MQVTCQGWRDDNNIAKITQRIVLFIIFKKTIEILIKKMSDIPGDGIEFSIWIKELASGRDQNSYLSFEVGGYYKIQVKGEVQVKALLDHIKISFASISLMK